MSAKYFVVRIKENMVKNFLRIIFGLKIEKKNIIDLLSVILLA